MDNEFCYARVPDTSEPISYNAKLGEQDQSIVTGRIFFSFDEVAICGPLLTATAQGLYAKSEIPPGGALVKEDPPYIAAAPQHANLHKPATPITSPQPLSY